VQAPTKSELIVNLKTAKALGLAVGEMHGQIAEEQGFQPFAFDFDRIAVMSKEDAALDKKIKSICRGC
jgi:hypothetical protein